MQHALLGVHQWHRGISTFFSRGFLTSFFYDDTTRTLPASKRHISFPGFISHAPGEQHVKAAAGQRTSQGRVRGAHVDDDVSFSEGLKLGIAHALSKQYNLPTPGMPRPGSALYGKWHLLSLDEKRMLHEMDVNLEDSTLVREVNQPGNEHDIELWSCLLEFAHRRMGRDGVVMIWQSVYKRRKLYQVDGSLAQNFWIMILNAAVSDENLLREVVSYAEWLRQTHNVHWPQLYSMVISYMLEGMSKLGMHSAMRRKSMVLRWHLAIAPSSGPSEDEFVDLITKFITRPKSVLQHTLQLLYTSSPFRRMYDILIPHLYNEGHVQLAMKWRSVLVTFNDIPTTTAVRPFLRCVGGYYPKVRLTKDELKVAGLVLNKVGDIDEPDSPPPETVITGQNLSYLVNRVHGETFGITEKQYNDRLGAKWFASSWVSVDFAINAIYAMGIQMIGPLSLQSISLREGSAQGVLRRIEQLRQLEIGLPRSNYVRAIQHYAAAGDDDALQELLRSDMHPDVFDDEGAQDKLLADCLRVGDWNTYRLVLSTRLAVVSSSRATTSDRVLDSYVRQGNGPMALKMMREMSARKIELSPTTSHIVSGFILRNLSPHVNQKQSKLEDSRWHVDLQVALCRQLAATRFPPAVDVWQTLLYRLGREKRLSALERLSIYVMRLYVDHSNSDRPMWISHIADIPQVLRFESPFPHFQKLPRDLPIRHEQHPLRQIFDAKLQNSIVRWGFFHTPYDRTAEGTAATVLRSLEREPGGAKSAWAPGAFHLARGIRLLAMLRDRGLFVHSVTVKKQAELRLVDLYKCEGHAAYEWVGGNPPLSWLRRQLRFSLAEAKRLCDEAWGEGEIVSSMLELERKIELAEQMDRVKAMEKREAAMKDSKLTRKTAR